MDRARNNHLSSCKQRAEVKSETESHKCCNNDQSAKESLFDVMHNLRYVLENFAVKESLPGALQLAVEE